MRARLPSQARDDLHPIAEDSTYLYGEIAAVAYHAKLLQAIARLERFPELGKVDPRYAGGTRFLIVASYRIIYTIVADEIFVPRILASRRNPSHG